MGGGRLLLIDGSAALYRSFFAIRGLATSDGRPTNAVFGFIRALRQMRQLWNPTHWAVVFDGGLSEERMTICPEYKAHRPSMPDALREQFPLAEQYLECARIAWVRCAGQEADDVVATLAARAIPGVAEVLIASGDKDFFQLVDEFRRVVPVAGQEGAIGPAEVREKTGVVPGQVIDWLALTGDSVDNIGGVPGVGPKTAARLLEEYGSVERLYAALDSLPAGKTKDALREHRDLVGRNLEMVRLRRDLPCGVPLAEMAVRSPDVKALLRFLESLEFRKLAEELRQGSLFDDA